MSIAYESWRCKHNGNPAFGKGILLCPVGGCLNAYGGCARENRWRPGLPWPLPFTTIRQDPVTTTEAKLNHLIERISALIAELSALVGKLQDGQLSQGPVRLDRSTSRAPMEDVAAAKAQDWDNAPHRRDRTPAEIDALIAKVQNGHTKSKPQ